MRIVEIQPLENGGHRNQNAESSVALPPSWAYLPDELEAENFPFGDITVESVDGVPTVTTWIPLPVPVEPDPEPETDLWGEVANAIREGVNDL